MEKTFESELISGLKLDLTAVRLWDVSAVTAPGAFRRCRFYKPTIRQRLFWARFRIRKAMKGIVYRLFGKKR